MPVGAIIEIVEQTKTELDEGTILYPTEVRINGQALYCSADDPIVVERISVSDCDAVRVNLTLLARRVVMDAEVSA